MFFPLYLLNLLSFFSILCPQFPDSKGKTKKGIFISMSCNSKRLVTRSRHFGFQNFVHKKWLGAKEKIKLSFSWSLLETTYFQKSHTCIGCFGVFTKLKRHMELLSNAGFPHTFSIKMFLIKYPIKWPTFNI